MSTLDDVERKMGERDALIRKLRALPASCWPSTKLAKVALLLRLLESQAAESRALLEKLRKR